MKVKQTARKIMMPALTALGFTADNEPWGQRFRSSERDWIICVDTDPMWPRYLRVAIGTRNIWLHLVDFPDAPSNYYSSKESLVDVMQKATEYLTTFVIPYLDAVEAVYINIDHAVYTQFSNQIQERIRRFSEKTGLCCADGRRMVDAADAALRTLCPDEISRRNEAFCRHREEILDIAAAWGEAVRQNYQHPWQWGWTAPEPPTEWEEPMQQYGLILDPLNTRLGLDPLNHALFAWNLKEIKRYRLGRYPLYERE
jgi:hypothetical protein